MENILPAKNLTLKNFVEDTLDFNINSEIVVVINQIPVTIPIQKILQIDAQGRKIVACVIDYQSVMMAWNYMPEEASSVN